VLEGKAPEEIRNKDQGGELTKDTTKHKKGCQRQPFLYQT
jgi:hypothetical protein